MNTTDIVTASPDIKPSLKGNLLKLDKKPLQPHWIRQSFSQYKKAHHAKQALTSVRTACHAGRRIKITTTYKVEIDDHPIRFQADVDNEGCLHCHTMPYTTYTSAIDLVKSLVEHYPEALEEALKQHKQPSSKTSKQKGGRT